MPYQLGESQWHCFLNISKHFFRHSYFTHLKLKSQTALSCQKFSFFSKEIFSLNTHTHKIGVLLCSIIFIVLWRERLDSSTKHVGKREICPGTEVQHCGLNNQELPQKAEMGQERGSHCQSVQNYRLPMHLEREFSV